MCARELCAVSTCVITPQLKVFSPFWRSKMSSETVPSKVSQVTEGRARARTQVGEGPSPLAVLALLPEQGPWGQLGRVTSVIPTPYLALMPGFGNSTAERQVPLPGPPIRQSWNLYHPCCDLGQIPLHVSAAQFPDQRIACVCLRAPARPSAYRQLS